MRGRERIAFALTLALAAGPACHDGADDRRADRAAELATSSDHELDRTRANLARDQIVRSEHVARRAAQAASADQDFEIRRDQVVTELRARHDVIANQTTLLAALGQHLPVTDAGRAEIREKLAIFNLRIDDTGHAIEDLALTPSSVWARHADDLTDMMKRLDDARVAAWHAVATAPRIGRGS
jgi:hypothetical protein